MAEYKAGIIGLGFIGAADQVSGDALGQQVADLDGTHLMALDNHPQVEVVAGSSRDEGRRERFAARTGARAYAEWREFLADEELDDRCLCRARRPGHSLREAGSAKGVGRAAHGRGVR